MTAQDHQETPTTVALAKEVAARHHEYMGGCAACNQTEGPWPCDAAKLAEAAARQEERIAALEGGLRRLTMLARIEAALLSAGDKAEAPTFDKVSALFDTMEPNR